MTTFHQTEPSANNALADLLKPMLPGCQVRSEQTQTIIDHPGQHGDILVTSIGRSPVFVEAEYDPAPEAELDAGKRLGVGVHGEVRTVEAAIALRYPAAVANAYDLHETLAAAALSYAVLHEDGSRFPQCGWLTGSVTDLADLIRLVSVPQKAVDKAADTLQKAIDDATSILNQMPQSRPDISPAIAKRLSMSDVPQMRRMACAIIANAMLFHERLAGRHGIKPLQQVCGAGVDNPQLEILEAWDSILQINYLDVFDIARAIVSELPTQEGAQILRLISFHVLQIAADGINNDHDLTGRVFQRLIADRKYLATFYTRNLVRPVALSRRKVDIIIGNPPWLTYGNAYGVLREALEEQSRNLYGIWIGGRYATHTNIASLFYSRCADLYLEDGGHIGMIMPHSALQGNQYRKWRSGSWRSKPVGRSSNRMPGRTLSIDFSYKMAWDLQGLEPNDFFPVPACVVFAERTGENAHSTELAGFSERWLGAPGMDSNREARTFLPGASAVESSYYSTYCKQGMKIMPRCLFFVEEVINPVIVSAGQTITVNPRRGSQDKEPWRSLVLDLITNQTIEKQHVFDVYLGETIVPYATISPLRAVLPVKKSDSEIPFDDDTPGGIRLSNMERRVRDRWQSILSLWNQNKPNTSKLDLLDILNYYGHWSEQLGWQANHSQRSIRVTYTTSGKPTASVLDDNDALVDETLYWITCRNLLEANYLLAIVNSQILYEMVQPLIPNPPKR